MLDMNPDFRRRNFSYTRIQAVTLGFACFFYLSNLTFAEESPTANGSQWSLNFFADAIESNYSKLGFLRLSVRYEKRLALGNMPLVTEEGASAPYSTEFTTVSQDSICRAEVLIDSANDRILHQIHGVSSGETFFFPEVKLLSDGMLTTYLPGNQIAIVSVALSDKPSIPFDPRHAMSTTAGLSMPAYLRDHRVALIDAEVVENSLIRLHCVDSVGWRLQMDFSLDQGFLPTRVVKRQLEGVNGPGSVWTCDNVSIGTDLYFPKSWSYRTYWKSESMDSKSNPVDKFDAIMESIEQVPRIAESEFEVPMPPGTRVSNLATGSNVRIPQPLLNTGLGVSLQTFWFIVVNGAIVIGFICYGVRRSILKRRNQ